MKKNSAKTSNKSQVEPKKTDPVIDNRLYGKLAFLLFIIGILVYANSYQNEYCLDDANLITENSITQKGFSGIGDHLTKDLLYGYLHGAGKDAGSSGWRPLPSITFSMEIGLWGKDKPHVSHLINILLYGLTVITLFRFLSKYLLKEIWISFCTTLLFCVHPIHTEVVANIKSRDEILCLLFLLFSLIHFWKYLDGKKTSSL